MRQGAPDMDSAFTLAAMGGSIWALIAYKGRIVLKC